MSDLFSKRMELLLKQGSLGAKLVDDANIIENKTFDNDQNFRTGMLYDWDMNELEMVDFKFEKVKTYSAGSIEVEYMIHFRPNFNPEFKYKELYYKNDGKERMGFYIDVLDRSKDIVEKWLIVGKDDRVAFDRYNAFKCNWCFEWISNKKYFKTIGCVRDKADISAKVITDSLGGTSIDGDLAIVLPSNNIVGNIMLGTKFMITDSISNPQVYEVIKIKDTTPLGTTKAYLKQCKYNEHTDVCGIINEMINYEFCFDLPIDDLPKEYGGKYHMICDCLESKGLPIEPTEDVQWKLFCTDKYLKVNSNTATVKAIPSAETTSLCDWHIFVDWVEYPLEELNDYFDITINDTTLSIKVINKVMLKYIVKIAIYDTEQTYYDFVEMEVVI